MAVERMKLLSVVGKEENINSFIANYLLESGLQPENALKVFEKGWKISYFSYDNTAKELLKSCKESMKKLGLSYETKENTNHILQQTLEQIKEEWQQINIQIEQISTLIQEKQIQKEELKQKAVHINPIENLEINLQDLYQLRYMRFRYGKVSKENFEKIKEEIHLLDAILLTLKETENDIWILYLTTDNYSKSVDSFFNIAKFERIWLPVEITGKPKEVMNQIEEYIQKLNQELEQLSKQLEHKKLEYSIRLQQLCQELELYIKINQVKRYMAHDNKGNFYVVGWIPMSKLEEILPKLKQEKEIEYVIKSHDEVASVPPTHLKNRKMVKPFETIVQMYGLPNYTELDPTTFVAITAFLMFGFMFGDVGHGFIILFIGLVMAKKKLSLGPVLAFGGVSSILFGFLYGSIFGKENIIPKLLISPMENIQTMLIAGISIGAIFIILAIILNIINGIKNKDKSRIFFDSNGLAGMLFYVIVLVLVVGFAIKGKLILSGGILAILLGIPLLLIFFKDRLSKVIDKRKETTKTPMVEKVFEMFEMLLSFVSNTISFVRLAAFAINHVGLCMAIYILSSMVGGAGNIIVSIIGNIIVIALEGLIVGIQVMRLEYYELFSRFYSGDGKEYEPIQVENTNH